MPEGIPTSGKQPNKDVPPKKLTEEEILYKFLYCTRENLAAISTEALLNDFDATKIPENGSFKLEASPGLYIDDGNTKTVKFEEIIVKKGQDTKQIIGEKIKTAIDAVIGKYDSPIMYAEVYGYYLNEKGEEVGYYHPIYGTRPEDR